MLLRDEIIAKMLDQLIQSSNKGLERMYNTIYEPKVHYNVDTEEFEE